MYVIATAGHVDHGKSTLVRALTGSEPDRLEEERRRGLTITLGYAWTTLPEVGDVAFVDVPGHERFVPTMLSGIGPVPAVLFVVAADDPWMPQAAEHLAALSALGVSRGVLAVTRADLADPVPAVARAQAELAGTTLAGIPAVSVSGRTGAGLEELRAALVTMLSALPDPDPAADVRLWVDRCFHVRGAGTVVTGTLPEGRVAIGDTLALAGAPGAAGTVRVRGVQSLGRPVDAATGVARVALNVAGSSVEELDRSSVLVTPGAWPSVSVVDVRLVAGDAGPAGTAGAVSGSGAGAVSGSGAGRLPERPVLHVGATSVSAHCRPVGNAHARLTLDRPLPLRIGDRALLRDPGSRRVWGVTVLDPAPPSLSRRGAARARAELLATLPERADAVGEVERRGLVRVSLLRQIGVDLATAGAGSTPTTGWVRSGDWVLSRSRAAALSEQIGRLVTDHDAAQPLDPGLPTAALANALGLPDPGLVGPLVPAHLHVSGGRVLAAERSVVLPDRLERAVAALEADLAGEPFAAPTADRLRELGLDGRAVAVAAKAGRLLKVAEGIVLLPDAAEAAAAALAELPQPFTTSEARQRLGTSRRVALPLLDLLDRTGLTCRHPDDRRETR